VSHGAYGFRLAGLDGGGHGLLTVPDDWPCMRLERIRREDDAPGEEPGTLDVDMERATVWMVQGDRLDIDRASLVVRLHTREHLSDDALIHPYLALPAAIASRWMGRQVLHGGGFLHDGRVWALTGGKGDGKSSTLAALMRAGVPVVSDDLLMVEGRTVFSGPRNIDLREEAAERMGGEALGFLGSRTRWRLRPGAVPATAELAGFVTLEWGDEVRFEPLDAGARLWSISDNAFMGPAKTDRLATLELAALPAYRLVRPRSIDALDEIAAQLLRRLS
jgi:hypothetical protein